MKKSMLFTLESAGNFREDENLTLPSGNKNAICNWRKILKKMRNLG